jgi:hypothetical protein
VKTLRKLLTPTPTLVGAGLISLVFGLVSAIAQTYDAAADFSATNNPNGVWNYGRSASRGSAFALLTSHSLPEGIDCWGSAPPEVCHNGTGTDIQTSGTVLFPAGKLTMHPGPNGENGVLRWAAPTSGIYQITGAFTGFDFAYPTTTDVAILHGSKELFSGNINSYNVPLPFSMIELVVAGETIDFTVGFGIDGDYFGDTTGLDATIRLVGTPFKEFTAQVTIKLGPQPDNKTFELSAKFVTGPESNGIDPLNEVVSFQIGTFSATLPAGSFQPSGENFSFDGVIAGVRLQARITQRNGGGFKFMAKGGHADLSGTEIPVKVGISIGDDNGSVTLKNTLLMAGSHPIKLETEDNAELP